MGQGSSLGIHSYASKQHHHPHSTPHNLKGGIRLRCKAALPYIFYDMSCLTPTRYYTISVILGTVALAYGSVPLYKMVCANPPNHASNLCRILTNPTTIDLPTNRLERPTSPNPPRRRERHRIPSKPRNRLAPTPNHIQRLRVRCPAMEIHTAAARGSRSSRGDGTGILHGHEQRPCGYHRSSDV